MSGWARTAGLRAAASRALTGAARAAVRASGVAPRFILTFHEVGPHAGAVPPSALDAQIRRARAAGFDFVTVSRLAAWVRGEGELPRRALALSFDDGLAGQARVALPILRRHGVRATIFPVVSFLGGPRRYGSVRAQALLSEHDGDPETVPWDYMSWEELDQWVESGGEVGGHTLSHPFLSRLDDGLARQEARGCREILAARYGRLPEVFCYPFGDDGGAAAEHVREAGFSAAVTTRPGVLRRRGDPFHLPRLPAPCSAGRDYDDLLFGVFRLKAALRRRRRGERG